LVAQYATPAASTAARVSIAAWAGRYWPGQRDLALDHGFLREHADETEVALPAVLDHYREGFFAAFRADRPHDDDLPAEEAYRKPVMFVSDLKVTPAKAAELRSKLVEIMDGLKDGQAEDPDGVTVNLLIGFYV
jgi:hypothetical protein